MKRFVRAEDFSVDDTRVVLGGRILEGSSILSAHIERRVSAELLGFYALMLVAILALAFATSSAPILIIVIFTVFAFGAGREMKRAWVLVLNIYQLGGFEVRGFTEVEAVAAVDLVDGLRGGRSGRAGARVAHIS